VAKLVRSASAAAVAALVFAALGVGNASAGLFGCSYPSLSTPFAAWGDFAHYYLSPGGGFETGSPWRLSGAASVVSGNEPYFVNSNDDSRALTLAPGGSAQGPYTCIFATDLKVRMFVRSDTSAPVRVDVVVPTLLGLLKVIGSYTVQTSPAWQPTTAIVNLGNLLSVLSLSTSNISVRVTAAGGAPVQVDDVFIDPTWGY
jgi:hypothetical protein